MVAVLPAMLVVWVLVSMVHMMILIFLIIFGARSLTWVILAFGEHNHKSGNWLQK